jgi:hypothetical protein
LVSTAAGVGLGVAVTFRPDCEKAAPDNANKVRRPRITRFITTTSTSMQLHFDAKAAQKGYLDFVVDLEPF